MRRKYVNAILLSALMIGATGTFVSCDDYSEDIANLQEQIDSLQSTLSSVQSQVNSGKWITSLSSVTNGFKVVFSDGSTYTITNGTDGATGATGATGAAGQNGTDGKDGKDGTIITVEDGYWCIDGEKTEYIAVTAEDLNGEGTSNVYVPYIGTDGYWYFYNEDGEAEKSAYNALGAAYAVKGSDGVYTLYIPDENGEIQSIELPTAAAKITGITFTDATKKVLNVYASKWTFDGNGIISSSSSWGGPATLPSNGSYIFGSDDIVEIQVSPADAAADIEEYTLINSKMVSPALTLTAEPYTGLIQYNGTRSRATESSNGLYDITIEPQVVSSSTRTTLNTLLTAANQYGYGYALCADGVFHSAFDVQIVYGTVTVPNLNTLKVLGTTVGIGSTGTASAAVVGTKYEVTFDSEAALYDAYFYIPSQYISALGITYDDATRTFTVGKHPETTSLYASFPLTVYTIDVTGKVEKTVVTIELSSEISSSVLVELDPVSVKKDGATFEYSLSSTGINSTDTWMINADLSSTTYELYSKSTLTSSSLISGVVGTGCLIEPTIATSATTLTDATNTNDASRVVFTVDNSQAAAAGLTLDTDYWLKTTFCDVYGNELNSVIVKVSFTAPSVSELFAANSGYATNGVINAYFYKADEEIVLARLNGTKYVYFSDAVADATITLNSTTTVGSTKKYSTDLAELSDGTSTVTSVAFSDAVIALQTTTTGSVTNGSGKVLGYGEALILNAYKADYEGWAYKNTSDKNATIQIRLMSPIREGYISATGSAVEVIANATTKVTGDKLTGYTYANDEYSLVKVWDATSSTAVWDNEFVSNVEPGIGTSGYLKTVRNIPAADEDTPGYFEVTADALSNTVTTTMPVTVTDVWGYTLSTSVSVKIVKN